VALQVHDNRSVRTSASIRPLIDTDDLRRSEGWEQGASGEAQECIGTERHLESARRPGASFAAVRQGKLLLFHAEAVGAPRKRHNQVWWLFGKDPPCAGGIVTEELAHGQAQLD